MMTLTDDLSNIQNTLLAAKDEIDRLTDYMNPKNKYASMDTVEARIDRAIALCTKALMKRIEEQSNG